VTFLTLSRTNFGSRTHRTPEVAIVIILRAVRLRLAGGRHSFSNAEERLSAAPNHLLRRITMDIPAVL
jgi:hypothetical protein